MTAAVIDLWAATSMTDEDRAEFRWWELEDLRALGTACGAWLSTLREEDDPARELSDVRVAWRSLASLRSLATCALPQDQDLWRASEYCLLRALLQACADWGAEWHAPEGRGRHRRGHGRRRDRRRDPGSRGQLFVQIGPRWAWDGFRNALGAARTWVR